MLKPHDDLAVAVFVKTLGLSPIKTRLAKSIGERDAREFYALSCAAIKATLMQSSCAMLTPYWAVAEEDGIGKWDAFPNLSQGDGDLGSRLHRVYRILQEQNMAVALIGADAPQISASHFENARNYLCQVDFVIGPTMDGGFYLFAGRKPVPLTVWTAIPYSDPQTADELARRLATLGSVAWLEKLTDVDTSYDLVALRKQLAQERVLPEQRSLLRWLDLRLCDPSARIGIPK